MKSPLLSDFQGFDSKRTLEQYDPTFRSLYVHFFIQSLLMQISNVELLYISLGQLSLYVRGYDAH
jgi:hypothetical protein